MKMLGNNGFKDLIVYKKAFKLAVIFMTFL